MLIPQDDLLKLDELDHHEKGDPALARRAATLKKRRATIVEEKVPKITEDSLETERMEEAYSKIGAELAKSGAELRRDRLMEHQWEEAYADYSDSMVMRP